MIVENNPYDILFSTQNPRGFRFELAYGLSTLQLDISSGV